MGIIIGVESQPQFPVEDISDNNASMLELMLANNDIVQMGHIEVEKIAWVFRVGHPAVVRSLGRIYDESERLNAIDHGVAVFEAASSLLCNAPSGEESVVNTNAVALVRGFSERKLSDYVDTAYQDFVTSLPNTRDIVASSSERFYPERGNYAVLGAALVRQFQLDANPA